MEKQSLPGLLLGAVACLLLWNVAQGIPRPTAASGPQEQVSVGSIDVRGSSAIRVQPDRAVVILGVETFAETPSTSHALNAEHMSRVRTAIRAAGVAEKDISTSYLVIYPEYENWDRHDKIRGYVTCNSISVTVHDVAKLEQVLVQALEAGATSVQGIEFSVANLRELRDQARATALKAALEKAQDMAAATGMDLGTVTHIEEAGTGFFGAPSRWTNTQNVVQDPFGESAILLEDGSVSLGQIAVQAEVCITVHMQLAVP